MTFFDNNYVSLNYIIKIDEVTGIELRQEIVDYLYDSDEISKFVEKGYFENNKIKLKLMSKGNKVFLFYNEYKNKKIYNLFVNIKISKEEFYENIEKLEIDDKKILGFFKQFFKVKE